MWFSGVLEQVLVLSFSRLWVLEGDIMARVGGLLMFKRRLLKFSHIALLLSSGNRLWQADGCLRVLLRLGSSRFGYLRLPDLLVKDESWGQSSVVLLGLRENPAALVLFFFLDLLLFVL